MAGKIGCGFLGVSGGDGDTVNKGTESISQSFTVTVT